MALIKKYQYKGYRIERDFDENGRETLWTASPRDEFVKKRHELEKQMIKKEWHGNECECSKCTLSEQEWENNRLIEEQIKGLVLTKKVNSITCNTMKECKFEIDKIRGEK